MGGCNSSKEIQALQDEIKEMREELDKRDAAMQSQVKTLQNTVTALEKTTAEKLEAGATPPKEDKPGKVEKPKNLTPAQEIKRAYLKRLFKKVDANKDKRVSKKELASVLNSERKKELIQNLGSKFLANYASRDQNQDGELDFEEFYQWVLSIEEEEHKEDEIKDNIPENQREVYLHDFFNRLDRNNDQRVSKKEIRNAMDTITLVELEKNLGKKFLVRFVTRDIDGDGALDYQEFLDWCKLSEKQMERKAALKRNYLKRLFKKIDADKNGKVSKPELASIIDSESKQELVQNLGAGFLIGFARKDANEDGEIDFPEFCAWVKKIEDQEAAVQNVPVQKGIQNVKGISAQIREAYLKKLFEKTDADHSKKISSAELEQIIDQESVKELEQNLGTNFLISFARRDKNNDGELDFKEFCDWCAIIARQERNVEKVPVQKGIQGVDGIKNQIKLAYLKRLFKKVDVNKNGKVSSAELEAVIESEEKKELEQNLGANFTIGFKNRDVNEDGEIDFDEFCEWVLRIERQEKAVEEVPVQKGVQGKSELQKAIKEAYLKKLFKKVDADNSGKVSEAELKAVVESESKKELEENLGADFLIGYSNRDKDKDGEIDFKEFCQWVERIETQAENVQKIEVQKGLIGKLPVQDAIKKAYLKRLFKKIDADHDKRISEEELKAVIDEESVKELEQNLGADFLSRFAMRDPNQDGLISLKEFRQWVGIEEVLEEEKEEKEAASEQEAFIEKVFNEIDADNTGKIRKREMFQALMGTHKVELEELFGKNFLYTYTTADADHDGMIDLDEFKQWVVLMKEKNAQIEEQEPEQKIIE